MTIPFTHQKAAIFALIAAFFLFGCDNNDSNADTAKASAEIANEGATTGQDEKTIQNQSAYNRVEKTYNGQTFYQYDIKDFPLKDEPLDAVREKAESGDSTVAHHCHWPLGSGHVNLLAIGVGPR